MSRAGRARATSVALLVLALVGACSTATGPAAPRTPAPVQASWPGCEAVGAFTDDRDRGQGPTGVGTVPSGFTPTRAVLCEESSRTDAAGDPVPVDLERTATRIDPLLSYLARPDEPPTDGACPAIGFLPPWLYLLDGSDRYVAPAIPRDGCGLPVDWRGSDAAWRTLAYTDRVVRQGR